ncbi:amino acid adenylation domain-containing protein [Actinokineospora sp. HUAS TT18]|uniref:amino acid adenylation domain-containing protein n=1 Tax=Actinokineospora sp. HUAS TT18 TaxID=3447451 RepID=UPI003F51E1A7
MTAPLSAEQRPIWFFDQLAGGDGSFTMAVAYRLTGALDKEALKAALGDVVARHEPLRTTFHLVDGEPVQRVSAEVRLPWAEAVADDVAAALAEHTNRPFDLEAGPLIRALLLRISDAEHVLGVAVHHIVADGWSLGVFANEMAACYTARVAGVPADLTPLSITYADHARAQAPAEPGHWRDELAGISPLRLPTDRPRPAVKTTNGGVHYRVLDNDLLARVDEVARGVRGTRFMVLMAAFQVLLSRYAEQDDLCVGSQVAGRGRVDVEPMIGLFTRTVAFRARLADDPTFREHLLRTRRASISAMAHPDIPFERLAAELGVERDPSRGVFFDAMFVLQDFGRGELPMAGLAVDLVDPGIALAKLDLVAEAWQVDNGLVFSLGYNTDLWDADTIARMARHFETLLRSVVADPDARVSALSLVDDVEDGLLARWAAGPPLITPQGVLDAVQAVPGDRIAVRDGDTEWSYSDLLDRARTLAGAMVNSGVRPGDVVAVSLRRSPDLIAALLGVWLAGAAYLPLTPGDPARRTEFLLADSGARLLVSDTDDTALRVDDPGPPAPLPPSAGDLAYLIYTSGSTGTPKAVAVSHAALAARIVWMRHHYAVTSEDQVLHFAATSFDTHAEELYPCLSAGATLILAPDDPGALPDFLAGAAGLTVLDLPTPYWQELVGSGALTTLPASLRLLILGADRLDPAVLAQWHAQHGDRVRVLNTYGPTETTIVATSADLAPGSDGPIGRPAAGTVCHVVDRTLRRVPVGVPGELVIGGAGLAHGYLGNPGLTARRFVPNPFGPGRLYRTGDRVRWRPDGQLEFLGRYDDQVKLRGFRVEPGETEAALLSVSAVAQAAVVVVDDRLVGYVVLRPGAADTVRADLADRLPAYLMPSALVVLDQLPLTAHGKLDRAALPRPDRADLAPSAPVAPRTDAEYLVAEIWCEVLGLDDVGVHDDFFALGGHSLLATRVVGRITAAIGLTVPLRAVFTERTVEGLAAEVERLLMAEIDELSDAEVAALVEPGQG